MSAQNNLRRLVKKSKNFKSVKALKHKRSVILDRCNPFGKERRGWIRDAQKVYNSVVAEAVYLNVPVDECKRRISTRKNHPTLAGDRADAVVDEFFGILQPPEVYEGSKKFYWVS